MEVQLLVLENCPSCQEAERNWRGAAQQGRFALRVIDIAAPEGEEICRALGLTTFPALLIDGRLRAIGVQTMQQALTLIARTLEEH